MQAKLHEFYELAQSLEETTVKKRGQHRRTLPSAKTKGGNK